MPEQLKPCPICASAASSTGTITYCDQHVKSQGWDQSEFYFCNCPSCGLSNVGIIGHVTREAAIAAWNTRSASPAEAKMREALADSQRALAMLIDPAAISVTSKSTAWATCVAAEAKARAALAATDNGGA